MALSFKGRHYQKSIILSCIRWYLSYKLSLRDLEEMMAERGVEVDHSTIHRWILRYSPELEAEMRKRKRPVGISWRWDEMAIIETFAQTAEALLPLIGHGFRPRSPKFLK